MLVRVAVLLAALATEPVLAHHSALHLGGSAAELLEPEKAFAMSARAPDARAVEVRFAIAAAHYMYRERWEADKLLLKRYSLFGPPGIIF